MSDRAFLDTNILVYLYSKDEPEKRIIASELVLNPYSEYIISTQVIGEFIAILRKKFRYDIETIRVAINDFRENFEIAVIRTDTIDKSLYIMEKYGFFWWDSMIVSSALENNCRFLYSEDLQHNQMIERKLKVINPFKICKTELSEL